MNEPPLPRLKLSFEKLRKFLGVGRRALKIYLGPYLEETREENDSVGLAPSQIAVLKVLCWLHDTMDLSRSSGLNIAERIDHLFLKSAEDRRAKVLVVVTVFGGTVGIMTTITHGAVPLDPVEVPWSFAVNVSGYRDHIEEQMLSAREGRLLEPVDFIVLCGECLERLTHKFTSWERFF